MINNEQIYPIVGVMSTYDEKEFPSFMFLGAFDSDMSEAYKKINKCIKLGLMKRNGRRGYYKINKEACKKWLEDNKQ